ncbi:MAG: winged helix-turn-helix transcriptional regulator [Chloroflexi bacterium]|nr:winged helix-turn-helix transcriptional regulator [Chloroflexota bacterium]
MERAIEMAHVIIEPTRLKILQTLIGGSKYIGKIAEAIGEDRSTVSYHLGVLEKNDFVSSEYHIIREPKSSGVAARVYQVNTQKLREAVKEIQKLPQEFLKD